MSVIQLPADILDMTPKQLYRHLRTLVESQGTCTQDGRATVIHQLVKGSSRVTSYTYTVNGTTVLTLETFQCGEKNQIEFVDRPDDGDFYFFGRNATDLI